MFPFQPPENIRKTSDFDVFQGDQKGTLGRKGLNYVNQCVWLLFKSYVQYWKSNQKEKKWLSDYVMTMWNLQSTLINDPLV